VNEIHISIGFRTRNSRTGEIALTRKYQFVSYRFNFDSVGYSIQIADDFLDDIAYSGQTGKDTGKDMYKPTILSKIGKPDASKMMNHHLNVARAHLNQMGGNSQSLATLIDFGFSRFKS
jgi:geranylgeranyl pyrophosphate synthase